MGLEKIHGIEKGNCLQDTPRRIIHDNNQITDPSQFESGKNYQLMKKTRGENISEGVFTFIDYVDDRKVKISKNGFPEVYAFLPDMGVVPYASVDGGF